MNVREEFQNFRSWLLERKDSYQDILSKPPYSIEVKTDSMYGLDLVSFKYSQFDSDFGQPFVKLCRGLVLDASTFDAVSFPFVKFHNAAEQHADKIDWKDCYVEEKVDGSLCKIVKLHDGNLLVSTNGTIDAAKAPVAEQLGCKAKNFKELIEEGLWHYGLDFEKLAGMLDFDKTYMFELTSPFNRVVVQWHETKLTFLGCRDNITFQEESYVGHPLSKVFDTPRMFPLHSLEECIAAAKELGKDEEGYVVCDKDFNRVKVKSPLYVSLHTLAGNYVLSYERALDIVRSNEVDEVLSYFPEFKDSLMNVKDKFERYALDLEGIVNDVKCWLCLNGYEWKPELVRNGGPARRLFAEYVSRSQFKAPGLAFAVVDGKVGTAREWLENTPSSRLVTAMGLK
jgi:hypothetical protein